MEQPFGGAFLCTQTSLGVLFFDRDLDPVHEVDPQKNVSCSCRPRQTRVDPASTAIGVTLLRHSWCDLNLRPGAALAMWEGKQPVNIVSGQRCDFLICPSGTVTSTSARSLGYIILPPSHSPGRDILSVESAVAPAA